MKEKTYDHKLHRYRIKFVYDINDVPLKEVIERLQKVQTEILEKPDNPTDIMFEACVISDSELEATVTYFSDISIEEREESNKQIQIQKDARQRQYLKLKEEFGE